MLISWDSVVEKRSGNGGGKGDREKGKVSCTHDNRTAQKIAFISFYGCTDPARLKNLKKEEETDEVRESNTKLGSTGGNLVSSDPRLINIDQGPLRRIPGKFGKGGRSRESWLQTNTADTPERTPTGTLLLNERGAFQHTRGDAQSPRN